ncbi:unnamed protein product, partial [Discosporangium mesarthrocarpum]
MLQAAPSHRHCKRGGVAEEGKEEVGRGGTCPYCMEDVEDLDAHLGDCYNSLQDSQG